MDAPCPPGTKNFWDSRHQTSVAILVPKHHEKGEPVGMKPLQFRTTQPFSTSPKITPALQNSKYIWSVPKRLGYLGERPSLFQIRSSPCSRPEAACDHRPTPCGHAARRGRGPPRWATIGPCDRKGVLRPKRRPHGSGHRSVQPRPGDVGRRKLAKPVARGRGWDGCGGSTAFWASSIPK